MLRAPLRTFAELWLLACYHSQKNLAHNRRSPLQCTDRGGLRGCRRLACALRGASEGVRRPPVLQDIIQYVTPPSAPAPVPAHLCCRLQCIPLLVVMHVVMQQPNQFVPLYAVGLGCTVVCEACVAPECRKEAIPAAALMLLLLIKPQGAREAHPYHQLSAALRLTRAMECLVGERDLEAQPQAVPRYKSAIHTVYACVVVRTSLRSNAIGSLHPRKRCGACRLANRHSSLPQAATAVAS